MIRSDDSVVSFETLVDRWRICADVWNVDAAGLAGQQIVLALATIADSSPESAFHDVKTKGFESLPRDLQALEPNLEFYRELVCSAGVIPESARLKGLEPEKLGQEFVEWFLEQHPESRQALIDTAWRINPRGAALFAILFEGNHGSANSDPTRYLPAPASLTAESAGLAARALTAISFFLGKRLRESAPADFPSWAAEGISIKEGKALLRKELSDAAHAEAPPENQGAT